MISLKFLFRLLLESADYIYNIGNSRRGGCPCSNRSRYRSHSIAVIRMTMSYQSANFNNALGHEPVIVSRQMPLKEQENGRQQGISFTLSACKHPYEIFLESSTRIRHRWQYLLGYVPILDDLISFETKKMHLPQSPFTKV